MISRVREARPVIHCITNYVTANDVANILLAAGASPIMADGLREAEEISRLSQGLVLNLGTLKETAVEGMLLAGRTAARLGHPVVLDPVGAGAAAFRRETALRILKEVPCAVIRGNASEIRALAWGLEEAEGPEGGGAVEAAGHEPEGSEAVGGTEREPETGGRVCCCGIGRAAEPARSRGVDVSEQETLTAENQEDTVFLVQALARRTGAVIVMTGEKDLVADGNKVCLVRNGHPMMSRLTGSGCMLDGILAAFLAAKPDGETVLQQTALAVSAYGICGQLAFERTVESGGGTGSFRMYLIDAMSLLTDKDIRRMADIES